MKNYLLSLAFVSLEIMAYSGDMSSDGMARVPTPVQPSATLPSQVLDLTDWKLNVPVAGSNGWSLEIKQPELAAYQHTEYFHVNNKGNAVVFKATVEGVTTNGSKYPRSELREMTNGGKDKADWNIAPGNGKHTMEITQAVTHLPDYKPHVVVGQIHDADDDVIVFRLEGRKLWVDHNGTKGALLTDSYELGTKFTVKFVAGNGKVDSYYNGSFVESYATNAEHCYFKAGMYTQSNLIKGDVAGAYGEVEIYNVTITHEDDAQVSDAIRLNDNGQKTNHNVQTINDNVVYLLDGRRVRAYSQIPKSIYISGRRKIVVR